MNETSTYSESEDPDKLGKTPVNIAQSVIATTTPTPDRARQKNESSFQLISLPLLQ